MGIGVLQINPLMAEIEQGLRDRFTVYRFWEMEGRDSLTPEMCQDVRAIVAGGEFGADADWMNRLPNLEIVSINGVGLDQVDLDLAAEKGIHVTTTPNILLDDVADLAVGLAICLSRQVCESSDYLGEGKWAAASFPLARKFSKKRAGVIGLGQIGRALAKRLEGFGHTIGYVDLNAQDVPYTYYDNLPALAVESDYLFVTASANAATKGIVNAEVLEALGPDGVLVNVARGSIVDEPALVQAILSKKLGGAALDVFADEPNVPAELLNLPNVLLTPHIASGTVETRIAMGELVIQNLESHFAGNGPLTAVA